MTTKTLAQERFLVKAKELEIGDVIRFDDGVNVQASPYMDFTVVNIDEKNVYVVRPYVKLDDFIHTGGVGHSIGEERFGIYRESENNTFLLLHREDPEKYRKAIKKIVDDVKTAVSQDRKAEALRLLEQL